MLRVLTHACEGVRLGRPFVWLLAVRDRDLDGIRRQVLRATPGVCPWGYCSYCGGGAYAEGAVRAPYIGPVWRAESWTYCARC